jgi:hypothetical protein
MSATIIAKAVQKGLTWLASRGKGVSKHVHNHARRAASVAARNPRYAARALGRSPHSMFRDPRPKKLVERVLKGHDNAVVQSNGYVLLEKQFERAVGKAGETIVRVIVDPRTGRIVTAFPVSAFFGAVPALAATPQDTVSGAFDERLVETLNGIEKIGHQWEREKPQRKEDFWTFVLDLLLDPQPAGDENEGLYVRIYHYTNNQADLVIKDIEQALGKPLPSPQRDKIKEQFLNAVAGAAINVEDEW